MSRVNPPPLLRIPKAFLADREVKDFIEQQNTIIWQLWNRTGGNDDIVEETIRNVITPQSKSSKNAALIKEVKEKEFELIETDTDLTTGPFEIIDCINTVKAEITLDPQAIAKDEVHIARSGSTVDIIGVVNGKTNITLNVKGYSVHLIKQITGNGWLQI